MKLYTKDSHQFDETLQGEAVVGIPRLDIPKNGKMVYIESYGCAMNFNDSEIVASILTEEGYTTTRDYHEADIVLINTCSIRDKAEQTIRKRLQNIKVVRKRNPGAIIGILGCMAERIKETLLTEEKLVDIVAGPDSYRSLPALIDEASDGRKAVNVLLSREETYADINPVRLSSNGISAFVSIMRGCDNMCAFCVVPFTRGRERSRNPDSILEEVRDLVKKGFKEITLLGQNVDSYRWSSDDTLRGKKLIENKDSDQVINFANLLEMVALEAPLMRIRFSTSHPKDMLDDVLYIMTKYRNICKYIHLPVQSGNDNCLERMNRSYTTGWYLNRIQSIRTILPDCGISTDIIVGFCGETESEFEDTLQIMRTVKYDLAYMYYYSERPGTLAAKKYVDDVPEEIKKQRLQTLVDLHRANSLESNQKDVGKIYEVLIEGVSKKNVNDLYGRTDHNKVCVFEHENRKPGELVNVKVLSCTSGTLLGKIVE